MRFFKSVLLMFFTVAVVGLILVGLNPASPILGESSGPSLWHSRYGKSDRSWVMEDVEIQITGETGTYTVHNQVGTLSNILYYKDDPIDHPHRVRVIRARWSLRDESGWIRWEVSSDQRQLKGHWGYGGEWQDPVMGFWDGALRPVSD